ncbi:PREDICTED: long-chain-alcohol oxidase FAO4A-like isoform X3 [Camelina sativa]|uniref:Long-chain-alcohol oxidase n=1 Tax=Camelina sativa TaxID=90675 RepID=A0ABM0UDV1_CAMSA|nr:PREDICTED: long-chain-alcohol oxidase FAO4A-like isoform X1 [Camelina sativa]XP_010439725.1 PREDICTED: long-chain-alcohol oxidase FAO4A-like isoform X3 [Camelina sativa]
MENQNKSCLEKDPMSEAKLDVEVGSLRQRNDQTKPFCANSSLTQREMESLVAICDTLIPSIDGSGVGHVDDDSVAEYFSASASQTGTPDRVAKLMSERLDHPKKWILRVALWFLSTWIGSFILCGRRSFTGEFPYFRIFCRLPAKQREDVLLNWSASYFSLLRMFFKSIKLITALVFFTQVDGKGRNLSWKAIGYNGPSLDDSDLQEELNEKKKKPEEIFGPLYNGIVDLKSPREVVTKKLTDRGFTVSTPKKNPKGSSLSNRVMTIRCDAVVVGSGSGGGVVAGVLAKAGYKVLVVESGNYYARSTLSLLEGQAMEEMYLSGGLLATSDMNVVVLAGSTVGGGSTINWSASIKTPEHVMNEWAEKSKLKMFRSDSYREAMDVVCKRMGVQCGFVEEGFNNEILRKGCEELGLPVKNIPRNAPSDHYCGFCCLGCKKGQKQGTSETWLVDLVESGNGLILPGCEVMEVLYDCEQGKKKKKASGVSFAFGEEIYVVESRSTVVACGALRTPHLLKRSGLTNANIGRNLSLHPVVMAWGWFPEEDKWPEKKKMSYEGGIMTAMSSLVNAQTQRSYGETVIQTPALHPGMFSGITPWTSSNDFKTRMLKFSRTAHIFALLRDKGTGTVNSTSCIDYNLNDEDEESLKKGLERVLKILAASGAEEIGTHNLEGKSLNLRTASAVEIERFVREESSKPLKDLSGQLCSAHQMGSCRMGIRPEESAVRPTGETWEVEGLFVADTSVFPTALGVNPMVTVQSIAYCIGLNVVDVLKRK